MPGSQVDLTVGTDDRLAPVAVPVQLVGSPPVLVETFAGGSQLKARDGSSGYAIFENPAALTTGTGGLLYVTDSLNCSVRVVTSTGVVATLAGGTLGYADGTGTAARFIGPMGIARDAVGDLYVTDRCRIRKVTTGGLVTTFARGTTSGYVEGTGTNVWLHWRPIGEIDGSPALVEWVTSHLTAGR